MTPTEDQIRAKIAESLGGLSREQAIAVLQNQAAHDEAAGKAAAAAENAEQPKKKGK